jgi:hypothetical protein
VSSPETDVALRAEAHALLATAFDGAAWSARRVEGGGNNRLYAVTAAGRRYALKEYFRSDDDPRDRLGPELRFLRVAQLAAPGRTPEVVAYDEAARLALLEWIDGERPVVESRDPRRSVEAADFARTVTAIWRTTATELPPASEACLSGAAHLQCVERRVRGLASLGSAAPWTDDAEHVVAWIRDELWPAARSHAERELAREPWALDAEIPKAQRIASPSDFGFHNALLRDGSLIFLDFEYAGVDDPAKLVCDFFCQPALPPPLEAREPFVRALVTEPAIAEPLLRRVDALAPLYATKWCCILLGEFLPTSAARRAHARVPRDAGRLTAQLDKICALRSRFAL